MGGSADLPDDGGDLSGPGSEAPVEPLSQDEVERLACALLRHNEHAQIAAMSREGVELDVPASFDTCGRAELPGTVVAMIRGHEAAQAIDTYLRALDQGAASCRVHLTGDDGRPADYHVFDLTERHGIVLRAIVPLHHVDRSDSLPRRTDDLAFTPKYCSVEKDRTAMFLKVDPAFTALFGFEPEAILGRRSLELIHPEDHQLAIETWIYMMREPQRPRSVRLRHLDADGRWLWVEMVNHNLLENEGIIRTDVVDVSDQMATQHALAERERLLDELADALPVGVLQITPDERISYGNRLARQLIGQEVLVTLSDVVARVAADRRPEAERCLREALRDGVGGELEVVLAPPSRRTCSMVLRAISADDGTVESLILCMTDVTERARLERQLQYRATYDPLTGAANRLSTVHVIEDALQAGHPVGLVFVDLDRFKPINDRYGHAAGDEMLVAVVERIRGAARSTDTVGRFGGDEFLVVTEGVASAEEAVQLAERLDASLLAPVELSAATIRPRASLGVAWVDPAQDPVTADELMARADAAMYQAKASGRNAPVLWRTTCDLDRSSSPADAGW